MLIKKHGLIDELSDYARKNLKKGYTKESLRWALINQGYSKLEVDKALNKAEQDLAREAPILKPRPVTEEMPMPQEEIVEKKSFWQRWFG
jgi:hypothetical protein